MSPRGWIVGGVTIANLIRLCFHLLGFLAFLSMATRLERWHEVLFGLGPPLALIALPLALRRPRWRGAVIVNAVVVAVYAAIWLPLLPGLKWAGPGH